MKFAVGVDLPWKWQLLRLLAATVICHYLDYGTVKIFASQELCVRCKSEDKDD
jgi:uncharacterized membrane protein